MDCHVALRAPRNDGTYVIASRRRSNPFPHRHCRRNKTLRTPSLQAQRSTPCHVIAPFDRLRNRGATSLRTESEAIHYIFFFI